MSIILSQQGNYKELGRNEETTRLLVSRVTRVERTLRNNQIFGALPVVSHCNIAWTLIHDRPDGQSAIYSCGNTVAHL